MVYPIKSPQHHNPGAATIVLLGFLNTLSHNESLKISLIFRREVDFQNGSQWVTVHLYMLQAFFLYSLFLPDIFKTWA